MNLLSVKGCAEPESEPPARVVYEAPAVIYEGIISTRAGTPMSIEPDPVKDGVDPADLFGDK